jgi:UDP-N-acetylmuramate dehydrogenase
MPLSTATASALTSAGLTFEVNANLARRSYWRVGGLADALLPIGTLAELSTLQRTARVHRVPVFVLGNGSNLLISDLGVRGMVVQLTGELAGSHADGGTPPIISFGAGLRLVVAMARARKAGWTGLEAFAGIPGTVGGAVRMNAGSTMGETQDQLIDVDLVLPDGTTKTLEASQLGFGYRRCVLPEGAIIASARFRTTGGDSTDSQARIAAFLARRKATQPLNFPSCGSTFRNPPGDHAGRLIEASGLKGYQIGGAQVSEKHANFIVNTGEATASDIRRLIEHVVGVVDRVHGVKLVREVHYAGAWDGWESSP